MRALVLNAGSPSVKFSSGLSNDMRDIEKHAASGNVKAQLALAVCAHGVKNSAPMRERICNGFEFLGLHFGAKRNAQLKLTGSEAPQLQLPTSQVTLLVAKARERWIIAKETNKFLK